MKKKLIVNDDHSFMLTAVNFYLQERRFDNMQAFEAIAKATCKEAKKQYEKLDITGIISLYK